MKLLLVYPRDEDDFGHKPIAISILSAIAREEGYDVRLLDSGLYKHEHSIIGYGNLYTSVKMFKPASYENFDFYPIKKKSLRNMTEEMLIEFKPDIVAMSVSTPHEKIAEIITRIIKEHLPDVKTVWGGPQATVSPKECLDRGADFVNIGEGLDSFKQILQNHKIGRGFKDIQNIAYLENGEMVKNPVSQLSDLDELPFLDYSIYKESHFYKAYDGKLYRGGDYMVSWGCPNRCSYCINHAYQKIYGFGMKIRRYSTDRVINELQYLKNRYSLEFIKFCDENFFLMPYEEFKIFAEKYKDKVGLPFTTATHPIQINKEKLELAKKAGCVSLSIGIETGNQKYRKEVLHRTDREEDIINAFQTAKKVGIRTMAFNMIGLPYYSREIYEDTVELNKKAEPSVSIMGFFIPADGTELSSIAIDKGFVSKDWKKELKPNYLHKPFVKLNDLSEDELINMRDVFVLYVKFPESYHKYIRRAEKLDVIGRKLRKELHNIYEKTIFKDCWYNLSLDEERANLRRLQEAM